MLFFVVALLLLLLAAGASSFCPQGCVCANTLVVCTCSSSSTTFRTAQTNKTNKKTKNTGRFSRDDFVLGSFEGLEFASKIYIHSCSGLTISKDTFRGLSVGQEIALTNLDRLSIDAYAFSHMRKCPDRLTIGDSHVRLLAPGALSGFGRSEHVWFKNVTVDRIATGAFRRLSDVQYVYFRESRLKIVENGAFGQMRRVENFFVRANATVEQAGNELFKGSSLGRVVWEDVMVSRIQSDALVGFERVHSVRVVNCTMNFEQELASASVSKERQLRRSDEDASATFAPRLDVDRSHLVNFCIGPTASSFANVSIGRSRVHFADRPYVGIATSKNASNLIFKQSTLTNVGRSTFSEVRNVGRLIFDECGVDKVESGSFRNSYFSNLTFRRCTIGVIERNSLAGVSIGHLTFDFCNMSIIASHVLTGRSYIDRLTISQCHIDSIESEAVVDSTISSIELVGVSVGRIGRRIFRKIDEVRSVRFSNNVIRATSAADDGSIMGDLSPSERLIVRGNRFYCTCSVFFGHLAEWEADFGPRIASGVEVRVSDNSCPSDRSASNVDWVDLKDFWAENCSNAGKSTKSIANDRSLSKIENSAQKKSKDQSSIDCKTALAWTLCVCRWEMETLIFTSFTLAEIHRSARGQTTDRLLSGLIISSCADLRFSSNSLESLPSLYSNLIVERCNVRLTSDLFGSAGSEVDQDQSSSLYDDAVAEWEKSTFPTDSWEKPSFPIDSWEKSSFPTVSWEKSDFLTDSWEKHIFRTDRPEKSSSSSSSIFLHSFSLIVCTIVASPPRAFARLRADLVRLSDSSVVGGLGRRAFEKSTIRDFLLVDSRIDRLDPDFTAGSTIGRLTINNCTIDRMLSTSLSRGHLGQLTIIRSRIGEIHRNAVAIDFGSRRNGQLTKRTLLVCFNANRILCRCDNGGLGQILRMTRCNRTTTTTTSSSISSTSTTTATTSSRSSSTSNITTSTTTDDDDGNFCTDNEGQNVDSNESLNSKVQYMAVVNDEVLQSFPDECRLGYDRAVAEMHRRGGEKLRLQWESSASGMGNCSLLTNIGFLMLLLLFRGALY